MKSTGVFCRLTCPARKPKRENTLFFDSIKGCVEAGFRPCLRCRPLERLGTQGAAGQRPAPAPRSATAAALVRRRPGGAGL
ncbi:Ada metal-binding domain-containing protein [Pseudomonas aeruginosa]